MAATDRFSAGVAEQGVGEQGVAVEGVSEQGRSARKRAAILGAAHGLFLLKGYAGTSMDDVAARAAVSKQTVYKHFADKQRLFVEVITSNVGRDEESVEDRMAAMPDSADVPGDLRAYARWHLADVMQPARLRLRRMLIGEAERFPELARAWYASGPERSCAKFARWFATWDRRGLVRTPDPMLAAQEFNWLVLSIPLNRAMAYASDEPLYSPAELNAYADEAVRIFLAAYGRRVFVEGDLVDAESAAGSGRRRASPPNPAR